MVKKKIKRKNTYFNTYDDGGLLGKFASWNQGVTDKFMSSGVGGALGKLGVSSSGLGGIANAGVGMVNSLMNPSGNETGVGNALQTIGSAASNIPGIGGMIGAGVNLVGGLVNTMFGSNINDEFVAQTKDQTVQQGNYVSGATDNASLLSDWGSYRDMAHVSQDDVGSDGWFSDKAKDLTKELNKKIDEANLRAWNSLSNTAGNIDTQNDLNILANFSSYGGPLTMRYTGTMSPFGNQFGEGGSIHIKPENRGKFTALKKRTGKSASWFKEHGTPAQRKMATFALNARKWKHEDGGPLTHGGDFSNGVIQINSGGLHSTNPYEGVQMGVDNQGIPNLVEEGEVVWNDYVFSNRLKPSKNMKRKNKYKGNTFADIAKELQKESEERPNDPISKRGLEASMGKLAEIQEGIRERRSNNKFDVGGNLRYAPIIGHGVGLVGDLFNDPDYTAADTVASVEVNPALVDYTPVGNYLSYTPLDKNFYINKLNAEAASTRRAIGNTSGGNRAAMMAGLLATDYNYGTQLGALARQAEEYNQQLRERVEGFNRQTNLANSEMGLKAGIANAESRNKATQLRLNKAGTVAAMRQAALDAYNTRRSNNINIFLDELGGLGTELTNKSWLDWLAKKGVLKADTSGEIKAKGGRIKTKKKKGYTYG